jgi:hypothetical protein
MQRAVAGWVAKLVLVIAAVEGLFALFGVLSIYRGNPYRLYYYAELASQVESLLPTERQAPVTGWPLHNPKLERDHPPLPRKCGSAWGGSFTFAPDVPDDSAWPYLASVKLGCEIANFGASAFGLDQTLLFFQQHTPQHSLVILGITEPMIITGAVSSLTFFDLENHLPQARITKPFFTLENGALKLHARPASNVNAIMDYYRQDGYGSTWTPLKFPFTLSVIRAIYRKFATPDIIHEGAMSLRPEFVQYRAVASAVIAAMADVARENDDRFVVFLIPGPNFKSPRFAVMLHSLAALVPDACLIDATAEVERATARLANPTDIASKSSHFSVGGNIALADALVHGLADCGIKP